jgi:hypothetical protein
MSVKGTHRIVPELPGYKTKKAFAGMVGRNPKTVWRWEKLGLGPTPTVIGRDIYYS